MSVDNKNRSGTYDSPIQKLPLEIITKIVRHLSINDILALASVSKDWRCIYLNQNIIWKDVCERMSVRQEDYSRCLIDFSRNSSNCKGYIETQSIKLFGNTCSWWTTYNRYNMILKNIKDNNFSTVHIGRNSVDHSFCTDDYIINVYRYKQSMQSIQAIILGDSNTPLVKINLKPFDLFPKLISNKCYTIKIVGNKNFLVFEICSVIFVYKIENHEFKNKYSKVIKRSDDTSNKREYKGILDEKFLKKHCNTKIDIYNDQLALVHPSENIIFLINLETGTISKELEYSSKKCIVDCIKCAEKRLMVGISIMDPENNNKIKSHFAVIYHIEGSDDNKFKVPLFGAVTQFKVTDHYIGIENKASATPFITKITKIIHIFWLDCDTFSFDCTRKFIYYNVNQSIFKYDLNKSRLERFEVVQKIAIDAVANHFSLTPINDRFLLVRSTIPNSYDIFDVRDYIPVRSIQLTAGFTLAHVGKLSIVFSNAKEYLIVAFC